MVLLLSLPDDGTPEVPMVLPLMTPFMLAPAWEPGSRFMLMASSNASCRLLLLIWNVMSVVPLVLIVIPPPITSGSLAAVVVWMLLLKVTFIGPLASTSVVAWK